MKERSVFVKIVLTIPAIFYSFKRLFKFTFLPVSELWSPTPDPVPAPQPELLVEEKPEIPHDFH